VSARVDKPLAEDAGALSATLEGVLLGLRELPAIVARAPIADALKAAIASLDKGADLDVEHPAYFDAIDGILARLGEGSSALGPYVEEPSIERAARTVEAVAEAVRRAREASVDALVARQDRMLRGAIAVATEKPPRPFRASVGVPSLHSLVRAAVVPDVDLSGRADPIDDDEGVEPSSGAAARSPDDDDDEEDGATLPALARAEAALVAEHLVKTARDGMSDLASFASLRRLVGGQPWTDAARFEQRLLDNLDALVSLGRDPDGRPTREAATFDLLGELQRYHREVAFPDPGRAFALAFVLGCVDGEPPIRAALLALRVARRETLASFGEGLALASSPRIGPALEGLLADVDPAVAAVALDVLRARREASFGTAATFLGHPDERVAIAAARLLAVVEQHAAASALLRRLLERDPEGPVAAAAAESLAAMGDPAGLAFARRRLEDGDALPDEARLPFVRLLALGGGVRDKALLWDSLGQAPEDARAAGWFGHAELVEWLIRSLAAANEVRRATGPWPLAFEAAAAGALHRITGAALEDPPGGSIEREPGALAIEAEGWAAYWEREHARFAPETKHRFGQPYSPQLTLDELEGPSPHDVRTDAALELAIASGGALRLETGDWVARQRARLAEARARYAGDVRRLGYEPGSFPSR
jgi:hypothetical protein